MTDVEPQFSSAVLGIVVDTPYWMYSTAVVAAVVVAVVAAAAVDAEAGRPVVDVVRIVVVAAAAAEAVRPAAAVVVCTFYSADLRDCTVSGHYLSAGSETYAVFEPLPRKGRHLMVVVVVVAEDRIDGPHLLVVTVGVAAGSDLNVLEAVVDVTPVPADCEPFDHPDQQQS